MGSRLPQPRYVVTALVKKIATAVTKVVVSAGVPLFPAACAHTARTAQTLAARGRRYLPRHSYHTFGH